MTTKQGGPPVKPCKRCGGPRAAGQYVKVAGKKVPVCAGCAPKTREWSGPDVKPDERRGRGSRFRVPSRDPNLGPETPSGFRP